jgi:hypothetical protein
MSGFLNAGSASELLLATACVTSGTIVVVALLVESFVSAVSSLEALGWGRVKSKYSAP